MESTPIVGGHGLRAYRWWTWSPRCCPRDIDFLLFEWLGVDDLTKQDRFGEHSRETFEGLLDLCRDLATRYFAPHNRRTTPVSRRSTASR